MANVDDPKIRAGMSSHPIPSFSFFSKERAQRRRARELEDIHRRLDWDEPFEADDVLLRRNSLRGRSERQERCELGVVGLRGELLLLLLGRKEEGGGGAGKEVGLGESERAEGKAIELTGMESCRFDRGSNRDRVLYRRSSSREGVFGRSRCSSSRARSLPSLLLPSSLVPILVPILTTTHQSVSSTRTPLPH